MIIKDEMARIHLFLWHQCEFTCFNVTNKIHWLENVHSYLEFYVLNFLTLLGLKSAKFEKGSFPDAPELAKASLLAKGSLPNPPNVSDFSAGPDGLALGLGGAGRGGGGFFCLGGSAGIGDSLRWAALGANGSLSKRLPEDFCHNKIEMN